MLADECGDWGRAAQVIAESVELLHDFSFFRTCLHIFVISDDGWSWLLAWAQLGVETIRCVPFSGLALEQLQGLQAHGSLSKLIQVVAPGYLNLPDFSPDQPQGLPLVCAHFAALPRGEESWPALKCLQRALQQNQGACALVSVPANLRLVHARVNIALGTGSSQWQEIRHRNLGSLTAARLLVGWYGTQGTPQLVEPGQRRAPKWPLDRFLEQAVHR